jgi:hypothetical protein
MPNIVPRLLAPFWRCSPAFPPKRPRRQMRGLRNRLYSFTAFPEARSVQLNVELSGTPARV